MLKRLVFGVVGLLLLLAAAAANEDDPLIAQFGLILSGHYTGPADGIIGPRSEAAIASFQRELGQAATGILTERQRLELERRFENAIVRFGIFPVLDETTNIWLYLPGELLRPDIATARGYRFEGDFAEIELETVRVSANEQSFLELYERLASSQAQRTAEYHVLDGDWFVVQGREGSRRFYTRFFTDGREHRGFSIAFDAREDGLLLPVVYFISELFYPFGSADDDAFKVPSDLEAPEPDYSRPAPSHTPQPPSSSEPPNLIGSGSGFFTNATGSVVTNAHVVDGCRALTLGDGEDVSVEYVDHALDLAIIQAAPTNSFLQLSSRDLVLGQEVVVLGFPLASILDNELRVTEGILSGLTGLRGDRARFTITAPIQPGNSGGPVINRQGEVVGVVVSVLSNAGSIERGDPVPQNVNFGIRPEILRMLLSDPTEVAPRPMGGKGNRTELSTAGIVEAAGNAVVQVLCYR